MSTHEHLSPLTPVDATLAGPEVEPTPPFSAPVPVPVPVAAAAAQRVSPEQRESEQADLTMRRDRLAGELAQLQWDLGGLAYEMAVRDHFRLDVLVRQAGRLQEVDSELAETERMLRLGDAGAAGTCPTCASMYARGASFCWKCGTQLLAQTTTSMPPAST